MISEMLTNLAFRDFLVKKAQEKPTLHLWVKSLGGRVKSLGCSIIRSKQKSSQHTVNIRQICTSNKAKMLQVQTSKKYTNNLSLECPNSKVWQQLYMINTGLHQCHSILNAESYKRISNNIRLQAQYDAFYIVRFPFCSFVRAHKSKTTTNRDQKRDCITLTCQCLASLT